MKIVVAGLFLFDNYEEDFSNALSSMGHDVQKLKFKPYFTNFLGKIEFHFNYNILNISKLNKDLIKFISENKPELLLIWRGSYIYPETIKNLKSENPLTKVVSYNNDDPFSPNYNTSKNWHQNFLWKYFVKSIPLYDVNFVFRPNNLDDYNNAGSRKTCLLAPYFNETDIKGLKIPHHFKYEVVFIGHPEPHRVETINFLIENNIKVKVFGSWKDNIIHKNYAYGPINPIRGRKYYEAINESMFCLCFYSKLNRDEYTIRSFEVPAAKGLILSEKTNAMLEMFVENVEAVYFDNSEDCLNQILSIKSDISLRNKIAVKGFEKVFILKAEVKDRAKQFLIDAFN